MKFTVGWLKDYLEFDSSIAELSKKLTDIGLEVEKIVNPKNSLGNFIVAKITKKEPHPNADRLSLCEVFDGTSKLKIVCGAGNAKKDLVTVLAPVGTILNQGKENQLKINKSKIRGEESNGMLCSEEELGLKDSSEGIIELNDNHKIGESFANYIDDEDIIIEIAITPNRVDCASVYGIARDLFAANFGKLKTKQIPKIDSKFETKKKLINKLKNNDCPSFALRLIRNVKNISSPKKIIKRFGKTGLKVISSLVDVTNFITIDYCRPLHVFDFDKIKGDIIIRHSEKGENFLGLDGENYKLDKGMIVICDDNGIISLAGILGGLTTSCDEKTKNVLIEAAFFCSKSIISSGRKLNIQSDARYRFERGIDPNSVDEGIEIATEMILKNCGGEPGTIVKDSIENIPVQKIIMEKNFVNKVLGTDISEKFVTDKLQKIGCNVKVKENLEVYPPSWRQDIKIKEDLVEEVARLYGLENIPSKSFTLANTPSNHKSSTIQLIRNKIKKLLVSRNIFEVITWSFTDEKIEKFFNNSKDFLKIKNPISSELSCLRSSLLSNIVFSIQKNIDKNFNNFSFFELGPVFFGVDPEDQFDHVCIVRSGKVSEKNWIEKERKFDFYDIKADLSAVLKSLDMNIDNFKISRLSKPYYHPGKSGSLNISNEPICFFGEINPFIINSLGIKCNLVALELNLSKLLTYYKKKQKSKEPLISSPYQASKRDFSFELKKEILASDIIEEIKKINNKLIKNVKIFDNYEGEKINDNKKALGLEVTIQSNSGTLTDKEINEISEKIISKIEQKFSAKLR
tara:strand:+ start:1995 stop:4391 length:2397 start_codon:yes stop_codon:yes gene_type:complete